MAHRIDWERDKAVRLARGAAHEAVPALGALPMEARWEGRCRECRRPHHAGEQIFWLGHGKGARCWDCQAAAERRG